MAELPPPHGTHPPPPLRGNEQPPQIPAGKAWWKRWWGIALIVFAVLLVIGAIIDAVDGGDKDTAGGVVQFDAEASSPDSTSESFAAESPTPTSEADTTATAPATEGAPSTTAPATQAAPSDTAPPARDDAPPETAAVATEPATTEPSRCLPVPAELAASIADGPEPGVGVITVNAAAAVKSEDFNNAYMIAIAFTVDADDLVGVWSSNSLEPFGGIILAVDATAQAFTVWPDADSTDAQMTSADDGVEEALECLP